MKIRITDGDRDFGFTVPNALALNGITARIACNAASKHDPEIGQRLTPEALGRVFSELNRIKKEHGTWVLVEVEKATGEQIRISL